MQNLLFKILLVTGLSVSIGGCYYDNEEELYGPGMPCNLDNVTYSGSVVPILQSRCYTCHFSGSILGGGIVLEGYSNVKFFADNGTLSGVINHRSGFSAMPKDGGKLQDCQIQTIEKWIADGALEN